MKLTLFSGMLFAVAPLFGATISTTTSGSGTASGSSNFFRNSAVVSFDAATALSNVGGALALSSASIAISQTMLTAGPVRQGLAEFVQNDNTQVRGSGAASILPSFGNACHDGQACFVVEWIPVTLGATFTFSTIAEVSSSTGDFADASGSDEFLFYEADGATPVEVFEPAPEPETWELGLITFALTLFAGRGRTRLEACV